MYIVELAPLFKVFYDIYIFKLKLLVPSNFKTIQPGPHGKVKSFVDKKVGNWKKQSPLLILPILKVDVINEHVCLLRISKNKIVFSTLCVFRCFIWNTRICSTNLLWPLILTIKNSTKETERQHTVIFVTSWILIHIILLYNKTRYLQMNYYAWKMLNVFHLKWIICTHGNWKDQNPGGCFGPAKQHCQFSPFHPFSR